MYVWGGGGGAVADVHKGSSLEPPLYVVSTMCP